MSAAEFEKADKGSCSSAEMIVNSEELHVLRLVRFVENLRPTHFLVEASPSHSPFVPSPRCAYPASITLVHSVMGGQARISVIVMIHIPLKGSLSGLVLRNALLF
jgi:hypothetical protein